MPMKPLKLPNTIHLRIKPGGFYNFAAGIYLLHMAIMATLTSFFPNELMRFRMPSFLLVAVLALAAIGSRALFRGIPLRPVLLLLVFLLMILSGVVYNPENLQYVKGLLFTGYFIKYLFIFALFFMFEEDPENRNRQLTIIALVTLFVYRYGVFSDMFLDGGGDLGYLTLGYGCAPWWIILAQGIFYYKNKIAKAICLVGTLYFAAFIANYGNRGSLVLMIVALFILLAVYVPLKYLAALGGAVLTAMLSMLLFLQPIMRAISGLLGFNLSQSRNFQHLLLGKWTRDSGRFPIWRICFDAILEHPLLGNGTGADRAAIFAGQGTSDYAHNMVIELCVDFGVVIGLLIYSWLLYIGFRMLFRCQDRNWRALFLPFYTTSMVEFFFSGSIYRSGYPLAFTIIYVICSRRHECFASRTVGTALKTSKSLDPLVKGESS